MNNAPFADLLAAANQQLEPQRMLFVFAESQLPDQATEIEQRRFDEGQGGVLTPVMCVDKLPSEIGTFADLVEESQSTGQNWDIMFAAVLSGRAGVAPASEAAEQAFKKMIDAIHQGAVSSFLAFNRAGELLQFS